jgi:chemotaxis protein MotB
MAGKGGGAWKVAYADFVTAMMAFFMVMWLTSQNDQVKEAVAEHFREPPGAFGHRGRHSGQSKEKNGRHSGPVAQRFTPHDLALEDSPLAAAPRVVKMVDDGRQHVGMILIFAEESAELDARAQSQLREFAALAAGKRQRIEIRGHASRRPLPPESGFQDAWQLSYARCMAAMNYLDHEGIPRDRMRLSQAGPSEAFSVLPDTGRSAANSRVEIFLLAEMAQDWIDSSRAIDVP